MSAHQTEELIAALTADLTPVRRLPAPGLQAALWLIATGLFLGVVVGWNGLRADWAEISLRLDFRMELLATVLTGGAAAVGAFTSAIPGRSALWRWLAMPPLLLWLALVGQGCLIEWLRAEAPDRVLSLHCIQQIGWTGMAAGVPMLLALRLARPFASRAVALNAGLATSALAAAAMSLYHIYDSSLLILVSHLGTVVAITSLCGLLHRPLLGGTSLRPA
jgi:hypothetical protein